MDYFQQRSCLETNPCVLFFTISLTLEGTRRNSIAYFPDFTGSVRTKKAMNGVYKTYY